MVHFLKGFITKQRKKGILKVFSMSSKNIIAFQGVAGAHSDLACRQAYPYVETVAYQSFDEVIEAVETDKAEMCMIPIENSHAGRVAEIHNLLPKTNLHIVSEHFMPIEHHLLGVKGATTDSIKTVYSHPQALMQCKEHLKKHGFKTHGHSNTATAASDIAEWNDKTKGALASKLAAELYGLEVIKENMHDAKDNTTVFIAMSKEAVDPDPKKGKVMTSLIFTARNIPAALYKALGGFATNHVNLSKLESYIPSGTSKTAQFFVCFEGHPSQKNVQLALEELGFFCQKVKVLGVYPACEGRFKE